MKTRKWVKITAFILLISILTLICPISCTYLPAPPDYERETELVVKEAYADYDEELTEAVSGKLTSLLCELIRSAGYAMPTAEKELEYKRTIKEKILPLLEGIPIYGDELKDAVRIVEEYTEKIRNKDESTLGIISDLYIELLCTLDSERIGEVIFTLSRELLITKANQCRARYELYGYAWYLEDALEYEDLVSELDSVLGKDDFIHGIGVILFIGSTVLGTSSDADEGDGLPLVAEELLMILQRLGGYFEENSLCDEEWEIFGELISLIITPRASILTDILTILKNDGYIKDAAGMMPRIISLYSAMISSLDEDGAVALTNGRCGALPELCRLALQSPIELELLLDYFETSLASAGAAQLDTIKALGYLEEYLEFTEKYENADRAALMEAMARFADGELDEEGFTSVAIGYMHSVCPYLTFALLND